MTESSDPEPARSTGKRVLLVEDQALIALDVEEALRACGCIVLGPVPSVAEALDLIGREQPEAALLDLNLLDGWATPVAEVLAARGVPFVLMTGCDEDTPELGDPVLAGAPRLPKPFGTKELRAALAYLLDGR